MKYHIVRDKESLSLAISQSFSIRGCLSKLGLKPCGGNYKTIHKAIKDFNLNTSHFTGMGHLRGKHHNYRLQPLSKILTTLS